MRMLFASIVIGPLMLLGALPAAAGQSISSNTPMQLAAAGDSTADRDTYTQKARVSVDEWQQKLHDFSEKTKAKGQQEGQRGRE